MPSFGSGLPGTKKSVLRVEFEVKMFCAFTWFLEIALQLSRILHSPEGHQGGYNM